MKQNDTTKLYNYIFKNAQMGVGTTSKLLQKIEDPQMCEHIREEHKEYSSIYCSAKTALQNAGQQPKGLSRAAKARTSMMISMETARNSSDSHIAEMLMTGSNMGIIQGVRTAKKCPAADPGATDLMNRLMEFEETNYQALKKFL